MSLNHETAQLFTRPDSKLPPKLRNDNIREVRDVGGPTRLAFQIVFDQHFLPYGYWRAVPEEWEMTYARVEHHNDYSGLLGWLVRDKPCIVIVVGRDIPDDILDMGESA